MLSFSQFLIIIIIFLLFFADLPKLIKQLISGLRKVEKTLREKKPEKKD
jgi:Sec-independent protein translocase protein TatA